MLLQSFTPLSLVLLEVTVQDNTSPNRTSHGDSRGNCGDSRTSHGDRTSLGDNRVQHNNQPRVLELVQFSSPHTVCTLEHQQEPTYSVPTDWTPKAAPVPYRAASNYLPSSSIQKQLLSKPVKRSWGIIPSFVGIWKQAAWQWNLLRRHFSEQL